MMQPPQNPAGAFVPEDGYDSQRRAEFITVLADAPVALRRLVGGLRDEQLDVPYRNWTIRQIVHHLADSHVNSYVRFKWTLTEDQPTIKAYTRAGGRRYRMHARATSGPPLPFWKGYTCAGSSCCAP
jgi:hypothetical protein